MSNLAVDEGVARPVAASIVAIDFAPISVSPRHRMPEGRVSMIVASCAGIAAMTMAALIGFSGLFL
jgi:hypothetical protein